MQPLVGEQLPAGQQPLGGPAGATARQPRIAGLLLAAGAGERYGQPKALADTGSGPWIRRGIEALAGCDPTVVVLGASAAAVAALLPDGVLVVENPLYSQGMGSSLRAGLTALLGQLGTDGAGTHQAPAATGLVDAALVDAALVDAGLVDAALVDAALVDAALVDAALVLLVDLPGVGSAVVTRVVAAGRSAKDARTVLARAAYAGVPGHPVLLGRDHWSGVIQAAVGDRGARDYLQTRQVTLVECGDIGSGADVDVRSSQS